MLDKQKKECIINTRDCCKAAKKSTEKYFIKSKKVLDKTKHQ